MTTMTLTPGVEVAEDVEVDLQAHTDHRPWMAPGATAHHHVAGRPTEEGNGNGVGVDEEVVDEAEVVSVRDLTPDPEAGHHDEAHHAHLSAGHHQEHHLDEEVEAVVEVTIGEMRRVEEEDVAVVAAAAAEEVEVEEVPAIAPTAV